jgi:hypothetical protein
MQGGVQACHKPIAIWQQERHMLAVLATLLSAELAMTEACHRDMAGCTIKLVEERGVVGVSSCSAASRPP